MEEVRRFGQQIKLLSHAFEQTINRHCEESGLTGAQAFLLGHLARHQDQPMYAKTLEQQFHLKHPTICGILQRLEAKGFITFETDAQDRRCRRIVLTQKGVDNHCHTTQQLQQVERQLLEGFTAAEADQFYSFLSRAAANVGCPWEHPTLEPQEETL